MAKKCPNCNSSKIAARYNLHGSGTKYWFCYDCGNVFKRTSMTSSQRGKFGVVFAARSQRGKFGL